jgi:hypothetical protein
LQMSVSARLLANYATLREPPELGWRCGGMLPGGRGRPSSGGVLVPARRTVPQPSW